MKKILHIILTLIGTAMLLTACGASSSKMTAMETAAAPASGTYIAEETAMEMADMKVGNSLTTNNSILPQEQIGRKLIRTIHLDVETDSFDDLLVRLQKKITELAGYVEQSDISGHSIQYENSRRRAYMTIRIPSTKLDQFVTSMEESGNVTNKSETTTDITLRYSDLESRKKSLTIEQDRIWELLEKADTIETIIALEERLSEIRYELESMESQLRLYDNQVDYSTIYVNISEVKVYTPTAPATITERIQKGFARNVENLKESAIDFVVWVASSTPFLLPLAIFVLAIIFILRKIRTRKSIRSIASNIAVELVNDENESNS